jgi:hypothetical protein
MTCQENNLTLWCVTALQELIYLQYTKTQISEITYNKLGKHVYSKLELTFSFFMKDNGNRCRIEQCLKFGKWWWNGGH